MKKLFIIFAVAAMCSMAGGNALAGWFGGDDTANGGFGWGLDLASGDCTYDSPQDGAGAGPGDGTQPRPLDGTGFGSPWNQ